MGSGSAGLIAYLACIIVFSIIVITGGGLVLYGQRKEKRLRASRREASSPDAQDSGDSRDSEEALDS